jgi:hypothetical protein
VNLDRDDPEIAAALSAVGQVSAPSSAVLAAAREVLWSAVAEEMLAASAARTGSAGPKTEEPQRAARPRRPGRSPEPEQRRDASPGA